VPTSSGAYINVRHYYEDAHIIELAYRGGGSLYKSHARRAIHEHLVEKLISSRLSPNSRYFLIWGLSELKEDGIELVVASFVGALEEYGRIWAELETQMVGEEIAASLKAYEENRARLMSRVDFVIGQYLPARKETVAS